MLNYFFALFFLLNFSTVKAQDSTVIYYDKDWEVQDWEIDAAFFRIQKVDSKTELITVRDYWISGEIQMTGSFISNTKKESKQGEFIWYNKDGRKSWEMTYLKGDKHGEGVWFFDSGKVMEKEFYEKDEPIGIATSWYENGEIESITKYNISNVDSVYYWYSDGKKMLEGTWFETEVEDIKYDNFWDSIGNQTIIDGNGFLIQETNTEYWKGEITEGLYNGVWCKYAMGDVRQIIGKMKFKGGNFKKGYLDFNDGKVKFDGGWRKSPKFPNGSKGLSAYIGKNLGECRENIIANRVSVEFVVMTDGSISEVKIISGETTVCQEEEIYKMFSNMPIWTPGIQMGSFVKVRYTIPIKYTI